MRPRRWPRVEKTPRDQSLIRISISPSADMVEGFLSAMRDALTGIPDPVIRSVIPSGDRAWVIVLRVPTEKSADEPPNTP